MKNTRKAVTLIELLISSCIFAIVMLGIYSAFHAGLFGYRDIEENINTYQAARLILGRLNLDLRNSFSYSAEETKFSGSNQGIGFLTLVEKFSKEGLLRNYAFVSYELEDKRLMRLCRENTEALNEKSEVLPEELASDVEDLVFSYGFIEAGSPEIKWKDSWEDKSSFPIAVKVGLVLGGKVKQKFERTIFFITS